MTGLELYQAAAVAVNAGEYDEAMQLLDQVDETGEVAAALTTNLRHVIADARRAETSTAASQEPSSSQESASAEAGTNSSTSDDTQDKSGDSTTDTESSLQSPAPSVENLSEPDLPVDPAPSSTASSTDGSTQETGPSQPSPSTSSEESPAKSEASTVPSVDADAAANDLIAMARAEYNNKNYDKALELVNDAEALSTAVHDTAEQARTAILAAKGFAG